MKPIGCVKDAAGIATVYKRIGFAFPAGVHLPPLDFFDGKYG